MFDSTKGDQLVDGTAIGGASFSWLRTLCLTVVHISTVLLSTNRSPSIDSPSTIGQCIWLVYIFLHLSSVAIRNESLLGNRKYIGIFFCFHIKS